MSTAAIHLLVVDDEENNRDMLSRRLQRSGYSVDVASDGREALKQINEKEYDLILLDQMMPGITGMDVLGLLRQTYSTEQLPIIMVTAVNESERIVEAMGLGVNDYITKPLDYPVALARIRAQLSRKVAATALRQREERFTLAAKGTQEGLWDWDLRSNRVFYSPHWKEMLGYREDEIGTGFQEWLGRVPQPDRSGLWAALENHWSVRISAPFEFQHRIVCKDGSTLWFLSRGLAVTDHKGRAVRIVGSSLNVTSQRAHHAVTGLPNRLFLENWTAKMLEDCDEFATLLVALDRAERLNQSLTPSATDDLLLQVTERLREACGPEDILAYVDNSEFAVLFRCRTPSDALGRAQQLLGVLLPPYSTDNDKLVSSASAGIAISNSTYNCGLEVLRDAGIALRFARKHGGSRCELFSDSMRDKAADLLEIETDLQKALDREEFVAYYQPRVRLSTGKIVGFEALIRWAHPTRGFVAPDQFIPIAEQTGAIIPIGRWIIAAACKQLRSWNEFRDSEDHLEMSVNVSPRQFSDAGLVPFIRDAIAASGILPQWFHLEITEGTFERDFNQAFEVLAGLKEIGVRLNLDDFGTGYSALSYLRKLPFDTLKIDQSFVREFVCDARSQKLVRTMVSMAHELGMDVVAEGIESPDQEKLLLSMSCQYGQGYLYSRPVSACNAGKLLN